MGDGPPRFRRDFACPAVLRILLGIKNISNTRLLLSLANLPRLFFYTLYRHLAVLQPRRVNSSVCPPAVSLAATKAIAFAFSSCSYLDVSVHCVFLLTTLTVMGDRYLPAGFPHSDTPGSLLTYSSPRNFVVRHVLLRLLVPRHPPCALINLTLFFLILSN